MSATAFLTVRGARQGDIKGDVTLVGREGSIALISVAYGVDATYDPSSGQISGKRQHKPISVTKRIDQTSPKLVAALVANETLTSVKIEFWRPGPEVAAPYFVIALTNAAIVAISLAPAEAPQRGEYEMVQFTYRKIVWTWTASSQSAEDDWLSH